MYKANPIRRGYVSEWTALALAGVHTPGKKVWFAVCPVCAEAVMQRRHGIWWTGACTRKNTKDALYRHIQEHHKPGLAGRG